MTPSQAPRTSSRALAVLLSATTAFTTASLGGCYQGEWRTGPEIPVAATTRLLPTRNIERWELTQSLTPYVVQIKGTVTPRCRHALYGTSHRVDTGKFKKVGGGVWLALSILTGIAGGAGAGFGGSGWFSQTYPEFGRPTMYAVGGALAVGGLTSCIASLSRGTKLRYALCGILTGLGGSVLAGAGISTLPAKAATTTGSGAAATTGITPLIDSNTFLTLAMAGGGLVGASILSGIIANVWTGHVDRVYETDIENTSLWDPQSGEVACGPERPLTGRTIGLEIDAENLSDGTGSEVSPLKMRVAIGDLTTQSVDLRGLRQALPSCGVLRVRLSPDILYEAYTDDYMPPVGPEQISSTFKPIHGQITPKDGIQIPGLEVKPRGDRKPIKVPGIPSETLAMIERRCRGDVPTRTQATPPPAVVLGGEPRATQAGGGYDRPDATQGPTQAPPQLLPPSALQPATPSAPLSLMPSSPSQSGGDSARTTEPSSPPMPTAGITPQRRPGGDREDGECAPEARQARFADCEHQCAKALELSQCLFTFRKCHLDARFSAQAQKERDACDLSWEQCLFKANIAPGSWRRCVDGCQQANEPPSCRR